MQGSVILAFPVELAAFVAEGCKKISARLDPVSEEGFRDQIERSGTVSSEEFPYSEAKRVTTKKGMSRSAKALIIVGITLGALVAIGLE
jgi:hypothetical protein